MAFASAAVPDCWAPASPALHNSASAANADTNMLLLMVFPLVMDRFKKGRPFVLQIISELPTFVSRSKVYTALR
jgi:hypothetical protein